MPVVSYSHEMEGEEDEEDEEGEEDSQVIAGANDVNEVSGGAGAADGAALQSASKPSNGNNPKRRSGTSSHR